jgi:chromosome segregation ATPase
LRKALKNKRNVEGEATHKEIVKLRSEVSGLRFDCKEKEKSFKIL